MRLSAVENPHYKHHDYEIRKRDPYAFTKYRVILDWLPQTAGLAVLNAGCGSGEMTTLLAQKPGWQVDAIDVDQEAIAQSQTLQQELALSNIEVSLSRIEDFQPGKTYHVIVSNDVLEHIEDVGPSVRHFHRLLKPGGRLFITVPAMPWLYGHHDKMLGHYRRYTRVMLGTQLAPYFDIERWRYFGATLIPVAVLYSLVLRKQYPVGKQTPDSLAGRALNALLNLERRIAWPIGTSLIAKARPRTLNS